METKPISLPPSILLEAETENFSNTIAFCNIIKQISEEYCEKISKFKECILNFYEKLSKIDFSLILSRESLNFVNNQKLSSIYEIINKMPNIINEQVNGLNKILINLETSINSFEDLIKKQTILINDAKKQYNEIKQFYETNEQKNIELMASISDAENEIVNYYRQKKLDANNCQKIGKTMEEKIKNAKIKEKEYLKFTKGGENFNIVLHNNINNLIKQMKEIIKTIFEKFEECNHDYLLSTKNFYLQTLKKIEIEINKGESIPVIVDTHTKLNKIETKEIPSDKYKIKIINNKNSNLNTIYTTKGTLKNNKKTLSRHNSNRRFSINGLTEIPDNKKTLKNSKSEVRMSGLTFTKLKKTDILEVVKKLYANFIMIDIGDYNIQAEEQKIVIKQFTDKLLSLDENHCINKNIVLSQDDKNYFFNIIDKPEASIIFLNRLNKIRSFGKFELDKTEYDDIIKIFSLILNKIQVNKDISSFKFCIILSQTFYCMNDGKKIYLQAGLKKHTIFKSEEMWVKLINYLLDDAKEKFQKLNKIEFKEKDKNERYKDIALGQLLPFVNDMMEFGFNLTKAEKICNKIMDEYNLDKDSRDVIISTMKSKNLECNVTVSFNTKAEKKEKIDKKRNDKKVKWQK